MRFIFLEVIILSIIASADGSVVAEFPKIRCTLLSKGASLAELSLRDARHEFVNIALSLQDFCQYGADPSFAGGTLGPCAGRIRGGRLPLTAGVTTLTPNEGENQLHGGAHCLTRADWTVERVFEEPDRAGVCFACAQPDGLDGWPGNRIYRVTYTLYAAGRLRIDYAARSDRETWFNLSGHSYWNLSGDFSRPAAQTLQVAADEVLFNDAAHLPVSKAAVAGTPFDFRTPADPMLRPAQYPGDPQLKNALGYNNAFLITAAPGRPAAVLSGSGRRLCLYTDAPALVVYSGGYLGADTRLAGGLPASPGCALALEAQDWPDAPNFAGAPYAPTPANQWWHRFVEFAAETE